jgi:LPXTG-site transpeptidase (sortase) family protein
MRQTFGSLLRASKWAEVCLWTAGFLALGYCGSVGIKAWLAQSEGSQEIEAGSGRSHPHRFAPRSAAGSLVGRVEIPRLGISVVVFEGTDSNILELGAGHWTGSALPGESGNVVMAAHRDTFFRDLRNIRDSDVVNVSTTQGTRRYLVDSTRVVDSHEVGVLAPTPQPSLTLITCYPFEYFGHAPQRFIVRAREIEDTSELMNKP